MVDINDIAKDLENLKEWKKCPDCGCPFFNVSGTETADAPVAWKDDDGKWYYGCARRETRKTCAACGKSQRLVFKRGKLEKIY